MEVSSFKKVVAGILLSCLFLIAACATGTITSKPYTPPSQHEQDPDFWQMWQGRRGLGG
jgi:hypothetical protein